MADFRAEIRAVLNTADAQSEYQRFVSTLTTPITIPVNINQNQNLTNLINQLQQLANSGGGLANLSNASNVLNNSFNNVRISMRDTQNQMRQFNRVQAETFGNQMTAWARNNSKAVREYGQRLEELHERLRNAINAEDTNAVRQIRDDFRLLQSEAKATGNIGKTFADSLRSSIGTASKFVASYLSVYRVFNSLKEGVQTIVELDTALVDLQKTSTASFSQLNKFYKEANEIAKQYGTTTKQIIQGAADWSRLGFNLQDAQTMSKMSAQFTAISPGMSVEESTNSLVSTMKAFGIEANDVLDGIMSKVNYLGRLLPKRIVIYGDLNILTDSYIG